MKINDIITEGTRCWKGYKKEGMKTMFGKRVPNCVKVSENEHTYHDDDAFFEDYGVMWYNDDELIDEAEYQLSLIHI